MALIGYIGKDADSGIQFVVSREVFRTPKDMTWSGSARYATHERHNTHALTEFTGLDPDKFSFDILLTAELGVNPLDEVVKIWGFERDAEAVGLVIGGKGYGKYRWNVVKHETKIEYTDAEGNMYAVEVSLDLVEYLKGENHNTSSASKTTETAATTIAPATTAAADTGGGSGGSSYTVKKGDNLWNLAKKYYGDGSQWRKIYDANRDVIGGNPNLIYSGQTYTIPA